MAQNTAMHLLLQCRCVGNVEVPLITPEEFARMRRGAMNLWGHAKVLCTPPVLPPLHAATFWLPLIDINSLRVGYSETCGHCITLSPLLALIVYSDQQRKRRGGQQ